MTKTTTYKSIVFAYPDSPNACLLGMVSTGCWYLEIRDSKESVSYLAHDCKGFTTPDNPDLVALYHECEGIIDPDFVKYGNPDVLMAITLGADSLSNLATKCAEEGKKMEKDNEISPESLRKPVTF